MTNKGMFDVINDGHSNAKIARNSWKLVTIGSATYFGFVVICLIVLPNSFHLH